MLKVLEISPGFTGGIGTHIYNIVKGYDKTAMEIDVAAFSNDIGDANEFVDLIQKKGGKVFPLRQINKRRPIKGFLDLISIIKNNGPYELIHVHMYGYKFAYFSIAARIAGQRRIVSHAHIAAQKDGHSLKNRVYHYTNVCLTKMFSTGYMACSKVAAEFIFGKKIVENKEVMCIPNSVDIEIFRPYLGKGKNISFLQEIGADSNTLIIGHIGYFGYQKNHPFMVDIIEKLVKMNIKFKWLFVGIGDELDKIKKLISDRKLEKFVCFMGYRKDIPFIISQMDVMALPSIFEGLPTVAIECQALGIPCVLSNQISKETDLGLRICKFISIISPQRWAEELLKASKIHRPSVGEIIEILEETHYTTTTAAKLYEDYVYNRISHFEFKYGSSKCKKM